MADEKQPAPAAKPAAHKPAPKPHNPFAHLKLKMPKGHETGPHDEDNAKYIRQKQLLDDLNDLFS